jgi:hypothetical protein
MWGRLPLAQSFSGLLKSQGFPPGSRPSFHLEASQNPPKDLPQKTQTSNTSVHITHLPNVITV